MSTPTATTLPHAVASDGAGVLEVLGDRRPALTVLVTDHWDEGWLIEIEVIAARRERRGRVRKHG